MTNQMMLGFTGGAVAAMHQRLVALGFDVPASELREDWFGPGTELAIRRVQTQSGLPATGILDDAAALVLGLPGARPRAIQGIVCRPDGTGLGGVAVRVYTQSLHGEVVAGETASAPDGGFSLAWPDGTSGGLVIRADGSASKAVPPACSSGSRVPWVRLSVGGEYRGAARFSTLMAAIAPRLGGVPLHALTTTAADRASQPEGQIVGQIAGVSAPQLSQLVLAHKLGEATRVDPAVMFALVLRTPQVAAVSGDARGVIDDARVSRTLDALLAQPREAVAATLKAAVDDNLIGELDIAGATAQIHAFRIERLAAQPVSLPAAMLPDEHACCAAEAAAAAPTAAVAPASHQPLRVASTPARDVLATVISDPALQQRVLEALAAAEDGAALAEALDKATGLSRARRGDVRFAIDAAALLGNHLPLVRHAQKLRASKTIRGLGDLARFDEADWAKLVGEVDPRAEQIALTGDPPGTPPATPVERIQRFARVLALQLEHRYPTAALAGRLAKDSGNLPLAARQGVQRFLDREPAFCVRHTHIDRFVHDSGAPSLGADDSHAQVLADLKTLQRVYKLTPRFDHVKAMLVAGHTSAYSMYTAGRERVTAQLTAAGAAPDDADAIVNQAEQVHATTLTLLGNFNGAFTALAPNAVAQPLAATAVQRMLASFPTLQSLFGANDYCSCEDCRAIHGPAAYFVDILQFLKSRPTVAGFAREVLLARRADLGAIELSCANTNGVVPYIDLVCEILEDAVLPVAADVLRLRQTGGSPDERRANPAFVNVPAYSLLRTAVYPHSGPFDLWVSEVREFLRQLGVPWHELLAAFQIPVQGATDANPTDTEIAGERFGFNPALLGLVVTAAPAQPWTHWGLNETGNVVPDPRKPDDATANRTGTWLDILGFMPIFLDRTKLKHRELVQLLQTRFINSGGVITIVEAPNASGFASCDTGKQTITTWTADALSRFGRFLRLWRQLGCTIWDLDKLLCSPSVGNNLLDFNAIRQLGRVDTVATRLGVPWDELLTLWSDLDRFDYVNVLDDTEVVIPSVYARRFRNAAVTQSSATFVKDPASLAGTLDNADAIAGIGGAFDLPLEDIQRIRLAAALAGAIPLNLANLSAVVRYAILAKALGLSVSDLLTAIAVSGVNPFTSPTTTLQFLAALDQMHDSGFTPLELDYLLRHGSVIPSGVGITDAAITPWLEDLRRSLVRLGAAPLAIAADHVVQRLSSALSLDPALIQQVLLAELPGGTSTIAVLFADPRLIQRATNGSFTLAATRANFGAIYDAYTALDKMRIVVARWRLNVGDAMWLLQHAGEAGWLQLHTFPATVTAAQTSTVTLAALAALRSNVVIQQTLASPSGDRLFDIVLQRAGTRDLVIGLLSQLGGWAASDLTTLASRFGWTTGASLVAGATAARIRDLMAWPRKLGTDIATTLLFATTAAGVPTAATARQLAKARYPLDQWYAVAASIQDRLREQKRTALVSWLLVHPDPARGQKWGTVEDLYGYYLIDPEMSPSAETTRIKQATASVQLFVQRCLLQLEPEVLVDSTVDSGWKQWEWMKRFRLWEANRKVFLYPENWIEPSQRRDKSPFFGDLEDDLHQGDVTSAAAADALLKYVHKLAEVSHLEVSGMWQEQLGSSFRLHVVARTRKAPYAYYYRRRETTATWTAWEPLDVGIEADHIMPAIWNQRMYMFWPEFTEKSLPPTPTTDLRIPTTTSGGNANPPKKYWEVALAWTEKRGDLWMPKRLSQRQQLFLDVLPQGALPKRVFLFRVSTSGRNLTVELYAPSLFITNTGSPMRAQWVLSSAQNEPVLENIDLSGLTDLEEARYIGGLTTPGNPKIGGHPKLGSAFLSYHFNAYGGDNPGASGILALEKLNTTTFTLTLQNMLAAIKQARVIAVRHGDFDQFESPFFWSDPQRTFFVQSSVWTPSTFYHPYVDTFAQVLNAGGTDALYDRLLQTDPDQVRGAGTFSFATTYQPTSFVKQPYPVETMDYTPSGAYSAYNWELFLHIPLLVARRLADNQRFDEALRWFHYIFNPTTVAGGSVPQRYWNPKLFRDLTAVDYAQQQIEALLQLVNQGDPELVQRVAEWRANPFDPQLIAGGRPVAFQKAVVMQYISTLVAWGDQLFRGDTIESINEGTQLYLMASQLLGPRPQKLRALQTKQNQTYNEVKGQLDSFSNAAVDIENVVSVPPPTTPASGVPLPMLHTFYFYIPPNDQLLAYWDIVADRLFKIRHGLNLDGVARPLALFEPAIDPGLLVRAAAAGVDLSTAIPDIDVTLPCYRFSTVLQTAHELCQDVRALGATILSALERRDAEEMSRIRATQEVAVLDAVRLVKTNQLAEANANRGAIQASRDMAVIRRDYYASRTLLNALEELGLALSGDALTKETAAIVLDIYAAAAFILPNLSAGASGFGGSPVVTATLGGETIGRAASAAAGVLRALAGTLSQRAGMASTIAGYQRRFDDWDLQRRVAEKEIAQFDSQLLASDLRIAIAQQELDVHLRQVADARVNAELLESKFTRKELYDSILSQLSTTYFQAYQLAYDLAKRASKVFAFDLGTTDPGFIQFGYWDSLRNGLHAGDKLLLDLRRLQAEYLNRNQRELELTRHVSLLQLDPGALVRLRQAGECFFNLPESLFDLDQPGHYLRRIKSVSVTLPCVTGPYTGVNATLTLVNHATRISNVPGVQYLPTLDTDGIPAATDKRFVRGSGAVQSVALSTGREDAGMFEVNFHEDRYLPFERLGAISQWRLELRQDANHFDVMTLSDVVLHLRYTARDGGVDLRNAARLAVTTALPRDGTQLLSARTELPDAWARLWTPTGPGQSLAVALDEQHFPFVPTTQQISITGVSAILLFTADRTYADYKAAAASARLKVSLGFTTADGSPPETSTTFAPAALLGDVPAAPVTLAGPVGPLTLAFLEADLAAAPLLDQVQSASDGSHHRLDHDKVDDILFLISYRIAAGT